MLQYRQYMADLCRTEAQWGVINRAVAAGPAALTADMYQQAAVAQVQTDMPEFWPAGTIEGIPAPRYMVKGLFEEYAETFMRDEHNPSYHRMARLVLPNGVAYPFDEPEAIRRNLKEYGDLSWYVANILSLHALNLADVLPRAEDDAATLARIDAIAGDEALDYGGLAWRLPGHNYVFHATNFLDAVVAMGKPLPEGGVEMFLQKRDHLAKTAGRLMLAISVVLQAKFDSSLAEVLHQNVVKVERRAATGTTLHANGDDRERLARSGEALQPIAGQ